MHGASQEVGSSAERRRWMGEGRLQEGGTCSEGCGSRVFEEERSGVVGKPRRLASQRRHRARSAETSRRAGAPRDPPRAARSRWRPSAWHTLLRRSGLVALFASLSQSAVSTPLLEDEAAPSAPCQPTSSPAPTAGFAEPNARRMLQYPPALAKAATRWRRTRQNLQLHLQPSRETTSAWRKRTSSRR